MGLGLTQYIPLWVYYGCFIIAFLSIIVSPKIGVLFFFPLLPYQNIFEKLKEYPFGKDLNDIVIISVLIGLLFHRQKDEDNKTPLNKPMLWMLLTSILGLVVGIVNRGYTDRYLADWKNYILLPVVWFLTVRTIKDRKTIIFLAVLLIIGIFGADYYFYTNLKWMRVWHYSDKARHLMTGLFVYLGANHYGAFYAHFIFVLLGFFLCDRVKTHKIILLIGIALTGYCLMYTFSRGAYIALAGGLIFLGWVKDKRILLILLLVFIFWRSIAPVSVVERIEMTTTDEGELEHSSSERIVLWNKAWEMFGESPLIGKGFNTFVVYSGRDTHNIYLKMLSELGIVGLAALVYLLLWCFRSGWNLFRKSKDWFFQGLGLGFAACVLSLIITNAFGDRWSFLSLGSYFWIMLALVNRAEILVKNQVEVIS